MVVLASNKVDVPAASLAHDYVCRCRRWRARRERRVVSAMVSPGETAGWPDRRMCTRVHVDHSKIRLPGVLPETGTAPLPLKGPCKLRACFACAAPNDARLSGLWPARSTAQRTQTKAERKRYINRRSDSLASTTIFFPSRSMHSSAITRQVGRTLRQPLRTPSYYRSPSIRIASFSTSHANMSVQAITSYEEFQKIIQDDKIAAIDFWATWCGPCKMISPMFEKFAAEAPADKIAFYKVDVDEQEKIAQECGITAMPTFVFFKKGEKITQVIGAVPQKLQVGSSFSFVPSNHSKN